MKTFVKLVIILTIVAIAMFDVGSPLWNRSDAAGAADDASQVAARTYFETGDLNAAGTAARQAAAIRGATLTGMTLEDDGSIKVTVADPAHSLVLHHISALRNWYNVTATATAPPIRA
jgi:Flp pilus assembly protein TadG